MIEVKTIAIQFVPQMPSDEMRLLIQETATFGREQLKRLRKNALWEKKAALSG
jgi:hypothetical protein